MRIISIISGIAFTVGNIVWVLFDEPKYFYVPLAVFISSLVWMEKERTEKGCVAHIFMQYFFILSCGNIVKQVFYTPDLAQINDYVFGGMVTVWLLHKLFSRWAIRTGRISGRK